MESERKRNTHNLWGSINGPSIRGRKGWVNAKIG